MSLRKILNLRNTLLFRLTILYAGIFTVLSFFAFSIFYYQIYKITIEGMDEELREEVEAFSATMSEAGLEGIKTAIAEEAENEDPNEEFFRLIDLNGEVLATTDMSSWGSVDIHTAVAKLKGGEKNYLFQTLTIQGREYKARMITAIIGDDAVLQIGETLEEAKEYLIIFRNLFAMLMFILMFLSAIIGWFMAKQALLDMEQVTQTAIEISQGAYDKRVQVKDRYEEIKRLGSTFNTMLDRIHILLQSMREINDNIAHDLRSPLARIRGTAEMTLMHNKSMDDFKNMSVSTIEECDSLIEMINTMLDITEAEAGVNEVKTEEFELVSLILNACDLFRPIADEKKIDLKVNLPETLNFQGDIKKMQRIVTNILENAIKYTPEKGMVAVSAVANDGDIQIVVEDTGIGISETDLLHIFDRFYRCDRSRSRGGVGLGLSLAKAYTESMNGLITVNSTINKGSTFTLNFSNNPV